MLVLSRRESERICLGDTIVVTIVQIKGDRVRLGIEAPKEVPVVRNELIAAPAPSLSCDTHPSEPLAERPPAERKAA